MIGQTRYRAHCLPKSRHWGVYDRNTQRYIIGVIAEDQAAAAALAFLLNREFAKWVATIPPSMRGTEPGQPDPASAIVPFIYRKGRAGFAITEAPPPPTPEEKQRFELSEYIRRHAPDSERRLIARLSAGLQA